MPHKIVAFVFRFDSYRLPWKKHGSFDPCLWRRFL